jgi:MoxR-like ATPase
MQERSVTIAGENYKLDLPYFATQNPIEQEVLILCLRPSWIVLCLPSSSNTSFAEEVQVVKRTTSDEINTINSLFTAQEIIDFQQLIRRIPVADNVVECCDAGQ